jgi:hypothetical protein
LRQDEAEKISRELSIRCSISGTSVENFVELTDSVIEGVEAVGYKILLNISKLDASRIICIKSFVQENELKWSLCDYRNKKLLVIYSPRKA